MERRMDPAKLPEPLRPFVRLFERWGDVGGDSSRYSLLDRALVNPVAMRELRDFHARLSRVDLGSCREWLDGPVSPLAENYERAKVHFTLLLLYGELEIEKRKV
jgi:hypothetical protein